MTTIVWDGKTDNKVNTIFDCYIAEALLSEGRPTGIREEALLRYNVTTLEELAEIQKKKLEENPSLKSLYYSIELPLVKVLWQMEQNGILLDTKKLTAVGNEIDAQIAVVKAAIDTETEGTVNLNSPIQLGQFLADKMRVPLGKTKTGKYATSEGELTKFKNQFPIISNILLYRELTKLRSTYVESLIQKVDEKSRVHTTYGQIAAQTGRLSSSNPNLQNIPVTSAFGQKIKSCFIATPEHILVSFDYSQQELRILAHLTGEKALIEAFTNNRDVHSLTASQLFNVPYEKISKQQRSVGKTINFGIIYGMSSYGMSAGLNIPQEDADRFIKQFYVSYPNIKTFYDTYLSNAKIKGTVETLLGRKRYVFEDPKRKFIDNATRRILMNYPIQGTAADLMKKAMVDVYENVLKKYQNVSLLLQIHDDLVFEMPDKHPQKKEIISAIQHTMCDVWPLSVPLIVDIKTGTEWGNLQKIEL